jgi:hypothetical protein
MESGKYNPHMEGPCTKMWRKGLWYYEQTEKFNFSKYHEIARS